MKKLLIFLCFSLFFATAINAQNCQAGFNYFTNGLTATFTDSSYSNITGGFQSSWNFGDGTVSNSMNPSHGYSQSGAYSVCLTISDSLCSNSSCSTIVIQSHPTTCQADFYFIPTGLNVQFHDTSVTGVYSRYNWNFDDGTGSSIKNPDNNYSQSGSYVVHLSIYDSISNCSSLTSDTVTVTKPINCVAYFTYNLSGTTVDFTDRASNYNSIQYNLGDGTIAYVPNPTHQYTGPGSYIVSQTVATLTGCSNTFTDTIVILPPCQARFTYITNNFQVNFVSQATNNTSVIYDFGDGNTNSMANPTYTYTDTGKYLVCQTVTNQNNCISTFCDTVQIKLPILCVANFSFTSPNDTTQFTNLSEHFTRVNYNFGDGNFSNSNNPIHDYAASGTYHVVLTIYNDSTSCTDSIIKPVTVTISKSCVARFELAIDTNQRDILFLVNSSSSDNTHSYFWDFGDGNTAKTRLPVHRYSLNQAYTICLTVSDSVQNCTSNYCDSVGLDSNGNIIKSAGFKLRVLDGTFIRIEKNNSLENSISVYPNPFTNQITVEVDSEGNPVNYLVVTLQGTVVLQSSFNGKHNIISMDNFPPGIYFIKLFQSGKTAVKRIVKI